VRSEERQEPKPKAKPKQKQTHPSPALPFPARKGGGRSGFRYDLAAEAKPPPPFRIAKGRVGEGGFQLLPSLAPHSSPLTPRLQRSSTNCLPLKLRLASKS